MSTWRRLGRATGAAVLSAALSGSLGAPPVGATSGAGATRASDWTVYHHDAAGDGAAGPVNLTGVHRVWTSPALDGQLYGEPLVAGERVVVATENDTLYALDARTGRIRWSRHLGTAVPSSSLPCGDIFPTVGITSTPVIDIGRHEVFAVADIAGARGPEHQLVALRLTTGAVVWRENVDPPGANTKAILQRVALTLDHGEVVFGYGGNDGDCSTYHGWVVSVPESGGAMQTYEVDAAPGEEQGAVWMGGAAPVVDASGDIWVAVGNGSVRGAGAPYDGSDSVLELSPSLQLLQSFAPSSWASDNAHDRDLGSGAPALLADGLVVQAGKSETAYLLSQSRLGGVGGQLALVGNFCGDDVDGGNAVDGSAVYLPCRSGTVKVEVGSSPPSLRTLWQARGVSGPPILAGGRVWAIDGSGTLDALSPATGAIERRFPLGGEANHFPTPSAADGRLFAPATDRVLAFAG